MLIKIKTKKLNLTEQLLDTIHQINKLNKATM